MLSRSELARIKASVKEPPVSDFYVLFIDIYDFFVYCLFSRLEYPDSIYKITDYEAVAEKKLMSVDDRVSGQIHWKRSAAKRTTENREIEKGEGEAADRPRRGRAAEANAYRGDSRQFNSIRAN